VRKLGNYISYLWLVAIVNAFALFPFKILYLLSDFFFLFLYYLVGYRQTVILDNLKRSFPNMSASELHSLNRKFTRHLCDLLIEGIKGWSLKESELRKRYLLSNPDILENLAATGNSLILAGSHYNNWEWGVVLFNRLFPIPVVGVYQPITNPYINRYLMKKRAVYGMGLIPAKNAVKEILLRKHPSAYMLLNDQSPSRGARPVWLDFLGQKTACLPGFALISIHGNMPVYYYEVEKKERGFYSLTLQCLVENPSEETVDSIVFKYQEALEKTIRKDPAYWLWSHKRWKLSPP
jgi:Kdo2-lipid IVA lauroyltransferase/acyltransferase